MFESLNMMIPFNASMTAAMVLFPRFRSPESFVRRPWPPLPPSRGSHLGRFNTAPPRSPARRVPEAYMAIMDRAALPKQGRRNACSTAPTPLGSGRTRPSGCAAQLRPARSLHG